MNEMYKTYLDGFHLVTITRRKDTITDKPVRYYLEDQDNAQIELAVKNTEETLDTITYQCELYETIVFGHHYETVNEMGRRTPLIFRHVVKSEVFDKLFYYPGNDLGYTYDETGTMFKLWAPTAYSVALELTFANHTSLLPMKRSSFGVYEIEVLQDLKDVRYNFLVGVNGEIHHCLDPYGKSVDTNSKHNIVVKVEKPELNNEQLPMLNSYCDAIIYEASIRDFTPEQTIAAFTKERKDGSGFTHLCDLGITHVQLMPVLDFASVDDSRPKEFYNWGYDVNAWMALENTYSSNQYNPEQVIYDLQKLVSKAHEKGIRVSLDVVFNHVFELDTSALQQSVPYYYFQLDENNNYSNATMCGNDVDSTRKMCSKLIVDACIYLLEYFDIDGLRFDLMGILDVDTLNKIVSEMKSRKADFMVYGEGWNMPSTLAVEKRASLQNNQLMPEVAHFSDVFRDTIKGHQMKNYLEYGYALGNTDLMFKAMNTLSASVGDFGFERVFTYPTNVINYVECHDNMTSWDQIDVAINDSEEIKKKYHKLMLAMVLLAQGIPFLHSGQEFMRTKHGKNDTYNAGDEINYLDYERMKEHQDVVQYCKDLIAIRKQYSLFRMSTPEEVYQIHYEHIDDKVISYILGYGDERLEVIFNPTRNSYVKQYEDERKIIFLNGICEDKYGKEFPISPLDVIILSGKKEN